MKTAVVIPGFLHEVTSDLYKPLIRELYAAGYDVHTIQPTWRHRTIFDWLDEADRHLAHLRTTDTTLIGFSFGAMIVAGLATRRVFKKVLLCSISPYWAEDIPRAKPWWLKLIGAKRLDAFKKYSFNAIVKAYKAKKTVVFLGSIEYVRRKYPVMNQRNERAGNILPRARFQIVPGAGHNIAHPNYIAAIKAEL